MDINNLRRKLSDDEDEENQQDVHLQPGEYPREFS